MHRAKIRHVIAAKLIGAPRENLAAAKSQELLHGRVEMGLPPDQKVEALDDQRREPLPKLARHGFNAKPHVGVAVGDGHGEIRFGPLSGGVILRPAMSYSLACVAILEY